MKCGAHKAYAVHPCVCVAFWCSLIRGALQLDYLRPPHTTLICQDVEHLHLISVTSLQRHATHDIQ